MYIELKTGEDFIANVSAISYHEYTKTLIVKYSNNDVVNTEITNWEEIQKDILGFGRKKE